MVQLSRRVPLCIWSPRRGPTTPGPPKRSRFGLSPVRSPLLGGSLFCFLFLQVLRCFSSLGSLPLRDNATSWHWVAPFGDPRITGYYAPPRGLSQPIASFIASESQGIHRTPLVTFRSYRDRNCSVDRSLGLFWYVQQHVKERCPMGCQTHPTWKRGLPWRSGEYRSRTDDLLLAKQAL
jgi:hypothetical protein